MNKKEYAALLELVSISLHKDFYFTETLLEANWDNLLKLSSKHGVVCLCWLAIEKLYSRSVNECPAGTKIQWYARHQQTIAAYQRKYNKVLGFAELRKPHRFVVLKGVDYARFWPSAEWREFGDLDIYSVTGDSKSIDELAAQRCLLKDDRDYKHSHIMYEGLTIENHHSLTSFAGSWESRQLENELRDLLIKKPFESLNEGKLLLPNLDFTAAFLTTHALNHFFYEGITLRQIVDWQFFLQKHSKDVDWDVVIPVLKKNGLYNFTTLINSFCKKYLGMSVNVPGIEDNIDNQKLSAFVDDVFSERYDDSDRRLFAVAKRITHRYVRMIKFHEFTRFPIYKSIWKTIAYSSLWHRKPVLE